ncbi:tetratricopeptide repeat protein [Leucobacter chinensis]|uniref:tetratricopeptide repeat protein n=1 Tax=Leucobacter chinensis TaxID=2851010 RepID=UPI001C24C69B|nr:tetratricopeptide repeat protein [Leucobacter chinensis]
MIAPDLREELDRIFAARDRSNMAPTIEAFLRVLDAFPEEPEVLYEVGGAYDTDGQEAVAAVYYQRALEAGLQGKWLRQCYLQYGSTLRNLGRFDKSLAVFEEGLVAFPNSESLTVFRALTLHAMGDTAPALGSLLVLIADRLQTDEIMRYEAAIRGNGAYLESLGSEN